jgi:hypothetical protein
MKQPEGFVVKGKHDLVLKLKISLYSLNISPRMWYHKLDTDILSFGFMRSNAGESSSTFHEESGGQINIQHVLSKCFGSQGEHIIYFF